MSADIYKEIDIFLESIFLGAGTSIIYDILRILRRLHKKGAIVTGLEDIIFFIFASLLIFGFMYNINGGTIRIYIFIGISIGIYLYEKAFGKYVVKYVSKILKKCIQLLKKCLQPFKMIYKCMCAKEGAIGENKKSNKKKKRSK